MKKLGLVCALGCAGAWGQEAQWPVLKRVLVATGLNIPVDVQSARDGSGRLFIVEQPGRIQIWQGGQLLEKPFLDIRGKVRSGGERGLLGLAFSPHYRENGTFYVNYTEGAGAPDLRTVVARYKVSAADGNVAEAGSEERVLVVDQPYDNHNGGQIAFGPRDGLLYVGMGDGGSGGDPQNNAQNPSRMLGKMLRLDVEHEARPAPEVWALGLRNPWRFSFDRLTHDLWIGDVGQGRFEEIDFQPADAVAGLNYGWNVMEGTSCYQPGGCNSAGMVGPIFEYGRTLGMSVTGGYVYRGGAQTGWQGVYLLADYVSGRIWGVRREGERWASRELAVWDDFPISTFGQGEDGELYVVRHVPAEGALYRLVDATPKTRADMVANAATGEPGAVAGGRVNVYGWGIVGAPGRTRVLFDGVAAEIARAENLGGQELIVAVAPTELEGKATTKVVVEADGVRSAEVEVAVPAVQRGIFDYGYGVGAGRYLDVDVTGIGRCARALAARFGAGPAAVEGCRASEYHAGAHTLTVRAPGEAGEYEFVIAADGVESRGVRVRVE